jgi:hypothetical protein
MHYRQPIRVVADQVIYIRHRHQKLTRGLPGSIVMILLLQQETRRTRCVRHSSVLDLVPCSLQVENASPHPHQSRLAV